MPTSPVESPTSDLTVAEVMRRWPETVQVFVHRRMACPGCPMAGFMTVGDAAGSYGYSTDALLEALRANVRGSGA